MTNPGEEHTAALVVDGSEARDLVALLRSCDPDELWTGRDGLFARAANEIERLRALEPIALAAIAYARRNSEPLSAETWQAWDALERAVEGWGVKS